MYLQFAFSKSYFKKDHPTVKSYFTMLFKKNYVSLFTFKFRTHVIQLSIDHVLFVLFLRNFYFERIVCL